MYVKNDTVENLMRKQSFVDICTRITIVIKYRNIFMIALASISEMNDLENWFIHWLNVLINDYLSIINVLHADVRNESIQG